MRYVAFALVTLASALVIMCAMHAVVRLGYVEHLASVPGVDASEKARRLGAAISGALTYGMFGFLASFVAIAWLLFATCRFHGVRALAGRATRSAVSVSASRRGERVRPKAH